MNKNLSLNFFLFTSPIMLLGIVVGIIGRAFTVGVEMGNEIIMDKERNCKVCDK